MVGAAGMIGRMLLHGAVLLGPPALWALWFGSQHASAGLGALAVWVVVTAGEDGGVGMERRVPPTEQVRALGLLVWLWVVGVGGAAPLVVRLAGVGLLGLGLALRRWAIHTLGPRFRASIHSAGPWVTTGPYAVVGHPSEWGLLAATLGLAWLAGSAPALVIWPLLVGLPSAIRVWREDRAARNLGVHPL